MGPAGTEGRPVKMATHSRDLTFPGCPEEENTCVLVLDANSQHPHKCTHTFTVSLQTMTIHT